MGERPKRAKSFREEPRWDLSWHGRLSWIRTLGVKLGWAKTI
jgi:hypothetical protein